MPDVVHDTNTITINNTGDQALVINSLTLSDTKNWTIVNPPAAGTSIAAGGSLTVTIKFIATAAPPHTTDETNDIASGTLVSLAGGRRRVDRDADSQFQRSGEPEPHAQSDRATGRSNPSTKTSRACPR